jgi:hypothetical protein
MGRCYPKRTAGCFAPVGVRVLTPLAGLKNQCTPRFPRGACEPQPPATRHNERRACVCPTLIHDFSWRTHRHNRQPGCQTTRFDSMRDIGYITAFQASVQQAGFARRPSGPGLEAGHVGLFPVGTVRRLLRKICAARACAGPVPAITMRSSRLPRRATPEIKADTKAAGAVVRCPSQPCDAARPSIVLEG